MLLLITSYQIAAVERIEGFLVLSLRTLELKKVLAHTFHEKFLLLLYFQFIVLNSLEIAISARNLFLSIYFVS